MLEKDVQIAYRTPIFILVNDILYLDAVRHVSTRSARMLSALEELKIVFFTLV